LLKEVVVRRVLIGSLLVVQGFVLCGIFVLSCSLAHEATRTVTTVVGWHRYVALVARVAPLPVQVIRNLRHVRRTALASGPLRVARAN
jgi:hypothetical protein